METCISHYHDVICYIISKLGGVEEEAVGNWSKQDFLSILITLDSN